MTKAIITSALLIMTATLGHAQATKLLTAENPMNTGLSILSPRQRLK